MEPIGKSFDDVDNIFQEYSLPCMIESLLTWLNLD